MDLETPITHIEVQSSHETKVIHSTVQDEEASNQTGVKNYKEQD